MSKHLAAVVRKNCLLVTSEQSLAVGRPSAWSRWVFFNTSNINDNDARSPIVPLKMKLKHQTCFKCEQQIGLSTLQLKKTAANQQVCCKHAEHKQIHRKMQRIRLRERQKVTTEDTSVLNTAWLHLLLQPVTCVSSVRDYVVDLLLLKGSTSCRAILFFL